MKNADLLVSLVLALIEHLGEASALFAKAKAENRDITDEELQSIFDKDDLLTAKLQADIDAARAAGR